jgi:hypothetical protein
LYSRAPAAHNALLRAISTQRAEDFERIPVTERKLVNPQSGLAFDLEGPDAQALLRPPAPRIDGARNSAEMVKFGSAAGSCCHSSDNRRGRGAFQPRPVIPP